MPKTSITPEPPDRNQLLNQFRNTSIAEIVNGYNYLEDAIGKREVKAIRNQVRQQQKAQKK